jgi:hypothetical protein
MNRQVNTLQNAGLLSPREAHQARQRAALDLVRPDVFSPAANAP